MFEKSRSLKVRTYCAQCQSACPIICTVEDGKLVKVSSESEHPNSSPLCPKGLAAPELVYNSQRLEYPLKRTCSKGEPDPGWKRISWDEAMETISQKLLEIKKVYGAHTVVFNRPGPGGAPSRDYAEWVVRLAYCFGSPNHLATGHVCQWHRDTGSKYTYGWETVPQADYARTALLLIWGHNPYTSVRCNVRDINKVKASGAKLVVIDPRYTQLAKRADLWLQLRPGTDAALILGLINLLIRERKYDETFTKEWTNAPFLIRSDTGDILNALDLDEQFQEPGYVVWDTSKNKPSICPAKPLACQDKVGNPALFGSFTIKLSNGKSVQTRPVLEHLNSLVTPYTPETVKSITGISAEKTKQLASWLGHIKPASYYSYNGIEQHTNAMQTNRALCVLYALTGNLDKPGGNAFFPSFPGPKGRDTRLLAPEIHQMRIAGDKRPLGPAGSPNSSVQAYEVFESILTAKPYPIKALVGFGGNLVMANSHSLSARDALTCLEFFALTELFMTPTAELADIVLPAATCYESFHVKKGFPNLLAACKWVQYRPRVIAPLFETRSDLEIIFDLAQRLGVGDKFWNGDIEAAFNDQLNPLGFTLDDLKKSPGGLSVDLPMEYQKYSKIDQETGILNCFKTPSGRIELFSQTFKKHGYDPLPVYHEPVISPISKSEWIKEYPLILTCSKLLHFCHGQHRALPSLRRAVPHPYIEINPEKARELNIQNDEWVYVKTPFGKIKLKARLTQRIAVDVVCIQHGWWQSCPELDLPGYAPYSSEGANANLLYSTKYIDKISGSVPYKAYLCKVCKIAK
ncbi:MAG: molybdopterin-dependent oxidoreductase [Deltaproteobacteria bacterium]|nr:MAG: molybdopterin-dependent oxidoreductase [Deltaproteobacteria bacterium]